MILRIQPLQRGPERRVRISPGEHRLDIAKRLLDNSGWRFLMMLGAAPALLTFFIRIFVPESSRWQHEREKGATSHWNSHDLWGVLIGGLGAIGIILLWTPEFPRWLQALGIGENDASTPAIVQTVRMAAKSEPMLQDLDRLIRMTPMSPITTS